MARTSDVNLYSHIIVFIKEFLSSPLLFFCSRSLAIMRLVMGRGHPFRTEALVFDSVGRQRVFGDAFSVQVDLQSVAIFDQLNLATIRSRHPEVVSVEGDVAILVRASRVDQIGRGKMARQLEQIRTLVLEGFGRNSRNQ